jgi:mycothiol synthase
MRAPLLVVNYIVQNTMKMRKCKGDTQALPSEFDLVVTAPDGSFAGFCVGWFVPQRRIAQIEPLGVHPRFHQRGLGRILLLEILRRFKEHGANSAVVETDVDRTSARRAYESVGFQQVHTIRCKGKWLNQSV